MKERKKQTHAAGGVYTENKSCRERERERAPGTLFFSNKLFLYIIRLFLI
jgi:hypothetical protein